jgi:hypothetical protein
VFKRFFAAQFIQRQIGERFYLMTWKGCGRKRLQVHIIHQSKFIVGQLKEIKEIKKLDIFEEDYIYRQCF